MIMNSDYLIVPLLAGFEWFDESLQMSLREAGWPHLTRPESMVMMHVQMNLVRPADIARSLRLTRQAVHSTINSVGRIVQLTPMGKAMRQDAQKIVAELTEELGRRVGAKRVKALREAFGSDWGAPILCSLGEPGERAADFRQAANKNQ